MQRRKVIGGLGAAIELHPDSLRSLICVAVCARSPDFSPG